MNKRLHRPCSRCNERFLPTGKGCRICKECLRKSQIDSSKIRMEKYYTKESKGGKKTNGKKC